jgi:hypothetical protein
MKRESGRRVQIVLSAHDSFLARKIIIGPAHYFSVIRLIDPNNL